MVQNIPAHAIYGANSNVGQANNAQKCDTLLRNYSQSLEQDTFTPQFTGGKETTSNKKNVLGKLLTLAAVVGGAVLLKKNWNKISQFVDDIIKKFKKGGKAKGTEIGKEIVKKNDKVAQQVKNIDVKHTNSKTRKLVQEASEDTVTRAQQEAYDKAIAYQPPTATQKKAMAKRHAANAAQRRELNSIANNSTGAEKLVAVKAAAQAEAQAAKVVTSGPIRHANGNIYHVENGAITKVELFQRNKAGELVKNTVELTDPTKIAKHMAKQGVSMSDLIAKGSLNVAA